jgi:hypothetical protein
VTPWTLVGFHTADRRPLPWPEVVALLHQAGEHHALWADLDGLQLSALPQSAPQTSRIWAWSRSGPRRLWRLVPLVRPDRPPAAVTTLLTDEPLPPIAVPSTQRQVPVDAGGRLPLSGRNATRLNTLHGSVGYDALCTFDVDLPVPVQFVQLTAGQS